MQAVAPSVESLLLNYRAVCAAVIHCFRLQLKVSHDSLGDCAFAPVALGSS